MFFHPRKDSGRGMDRKCCFAHVGWDMTGYRRLFCPLNTSSLTGDWGEGRGCVRRSSGCWVFIA